MSHFGTVWVGSYGPTDAVIALLGQSPGSVEEHEGRPFVGPAGNTLRTACVEARLNWPALMKVNTFKHRLLAKDPNTIKALVLKVRHQVVKELGTLARLRVVITLGNEAMYCLTDMWGVLQHKGIPVRTPILDGITMVPALHPSFVRRNGDQGEYRESLIASLKLGLAIAKKEGRHAK
jgi:DNA polymerase